MLTATIRFTLLVTLMTIMLTPANADEPKPVRVLVWDEQQPEQAKAYENFLGNAIADYLGKQPGLRVLSVNLGCLSRDSIPRHSKRPMSSSGGGTAACRRQTSRVEEIVQRVLDGRLGFIGFHSAHFSRLSCA